MKNLILFVCISLSVMTLRSQSAYDVCNGDTLNLQVTVPMNVSLQWQQSLDSIMWYDIPGAVQNIYSVNGAVSTRYYRALFTGQLCDPFPSDVKKVNVVLPPVAGITNLDQAYCVAGASVVLNGVPSGGTFSGAGISGSSFNPATAGVGAHPITYTVMNSYGCKGSVTLSTNVVPAPTTASAGPDITASANTVAMAGNTPTAGTGLWTIASGTGGSFANATSPVSNFTGTPNTVYQLVWTISNPPCSPSSDTVSVTMPTGSTLPSVICGSPSYTLYVHPTDNAPAMLWGCVGITSGATDQWNGAANTPLIVQMCGQNTAAWVCDNLVAYGYSDWYLPAYNELDCVRSSAAAIGGFSADKYWSSSEGAGILYLNAYYRTFPTGTSGAGGKSSTQARVRCVRKD